MSAKRDWSVFEAFELEYAKQHASYEHNLKMFDAMYEQARSMNALSSGDPLEGIEVHTRVAKIFNAIRKTDPEDRNPAR